MLNALVRARMFLLMLGEYTINLICLSQIQMGMLPIHAHKWYKSINSPPNAVIKIFGSLKSQNGKYRYWGKDWRGTVNDSNYESIMLTVIPERRNKP